VTPRGAGEEASAVLLCEETTLLAEVVRRTVLNAGFVIATEVTRWIEAVEQTAQLRPDVVVVDLALAGQIGLQLVSALRAVAPECPVIVVLPLGVMPDATVLEGVAAVIDPTDLRPLGRALDDIAGGAHQAS
jgi:ActR/RegA family two-component response regulator